MHKKIIFSNIANNIDGMARASNISVIGKAIYKYNEQGVGIGTPGSLIRIGSKILFFSLFPGSGQNGKTHTISKFRCNDNNNIAVINDILLSHEVVQISQEVNREYILKNKIIDFVKQKGALTFFVDDISLIKTFIKDIDSMYKYMSVVGIGISSLPFKNKKEMTDYKAVVSIIDIKECIPIFDNTFVDGIGVIIKLINFKNMEYNFLIYSGLFSNHKRNFLYIDGVKRFKNCRNKDFLFNDKINWIFEKEDPNIDKKDVVEGSFDLSNPLGYAKNTEIKYSYISTSALNATNTMSYHYVKSI
jgi:hypothetical protein